MVQVNVGKTKRGGKNRSTPEENNHPDRELLWLASSQYTGGRVSHQALQWKNSQLLTFGTLYRLFRLSFSLSIHHFQQSVHISAALCLPHLVFIRDKE